MQFLLVTTDKGVHARIYNDDDKLIFWTKDYDTESEVIERCNEVKVGAAAAPIYRQ